MKERLVTLGLAACALALVYALFIPKLAPPEVAAPLPLSTESRAAGYQAAWRWLRAEGIPVVAWRDKYDLLSAPTKLSATGNILITTLPSKIPATASEASQLDAWIERGNTLLVMAALDDTPAWAFAAGPHLEKEVKRLTRLDMKVEDSDSGPAVPQAQPLGKPVRKAVTEILSDRNSVVEARGTHALLANVRSVHITSDLPASRWKGHPMDAAAVLVLGRVKGSDDPAIWLRRQGQGQIVVFAFAGAFSNRDIGSDDNGTLLSNIVGWSRSPAGSVIFDDAHQGAVNYYDAKAFYADPRLHRTVAWLVLLWFVFVIGIQRLRMHAGDWRPIDITAFVGVTGEFLASSLTPVTAGARRISNFFASIQRRLKLPEDGTPQWDWLSRQASVNPSDLESLRAMHERLAAGKRVDLMKLHSLIRHLQEKIE